MQEYLIEEELKGREYLISELKKIGYSYIYNGGNYVTIKTNLVPDVVEERLLSDKKIAVKISRYEILRDYIRVTTGSIKYMKIFIVLILCA